MNRVRINRISIRIILAGICISMTQGCVTFAPPSPWLTFGGPGTTPKGGGNAAVALGSGVAQFEGAHASGMGWFGRYKYGVGDRWDIGVDAIGASHGDEYTFTTKFAARYQLLPHWRLEGGIGVADDSEGKSANSDLGLTWGTLHKNTSWNYYSTLRFAYAKGFPGDVFDKHSGDTPLPDAFFGLINIGTQAHVNDHITFIFEGGYGYVYPEDHSPGNLLFVSCGILCNIGKMK